MQQDILSAIENPLPEEIETKNLAATFGGKEGEWKLVTAAHYRKQELQDSEDLDIAPQHPYVSDRRCYAYGR